MATNFGTKLTTTGPPER